ncbi:uncharacterized protein LOC113319517 isoform X2 [Papaver somniferum]|uniref:uncharacterized protein LOC113319517 isoform X2 n=1 Tax=Papaver somniferum TaxID=3469 RepID=UPI000E704C11|nr:uncharacterized protein LOC113319517 isoform X2 [Papaver somniferum]
MAISISTEDVRLVTNAPIESPNTCDDGMWSGTTTAGVTVRKAIVLGADMQKTDITGTKKKETTKIIQIGTFAALTRAGYEKHADHLVDRFLRFVDKAKHLFIDITTMVEEVYELVLQDIKDGLLPEQHRGIILLGGYNRGCDDPKFFFVNNAGVLDLMNTDIDCIRGVFQTGSGSGAAFVYMDERYRREEDDLTAARTLVEDAIYSGIQSDSHSGIGIEVVVRPLMGVGKVESMTIKEYERRRNIRHADS